MISTQTYLKMHGRRIRRLASAFAGDESGGTAIEYGLIVALIFLAIIGAVNSVANNTTDMYNEVSSALQNTT